MIEQGAIWVPSWMRQMESAFEAFARHEERLRALSLRPDRLRAPPGALHARTPPRTSAGSSSSPAPRCACSRRTTPTSRAAGGRSSASRRRSATPSDEARERFYRDNFLDLMGSAATALAA